MNLSFLRCIPLHSHHHLPKVSCFAITPKSSSSFLRSVSATSVPARDRVIDFGKYQGKMLGTLPSNYLKWVSKSLRARDFEDWAKLADQVLEDPVYKDRIEWEFAEKLLNGDVPNTSLSRSDQNAVLDLLEISKRFGWDNEDKVGWSKIDFGLLGTSMGGRIPRVDENGGIQRELKSKLKREKAGSCNGDVLRRERRERLKLKRMMKPGIANKSTEAEDDNDDEEKEEVRFERNPFPGREALLKKVINRRSL